MADYNSSYTGTEIDRVIGYGINVSSDIQNQINSKEPTLTKGNLTEATSAILTILGGTNAVIGSGLSIQVKQANGSQSGYITSADWTTFNNKQNAITGGASTITTLDLTADRVLISSGTGKVAISSITTTTLGYLDATSSIQTQLNGKEPTLTKGDLTEATSSVLTITGGTSSQIGSGTSIQVKQATTSQDGYLSSTDWNTFNNKQNALSFGDLAGTTNQINLSASGTGVLVGGTNITLSLPQSIDISANMTLNGITLSGLTANRAIATNGSKLLVSSNTTDTELGYLSGVTSLIQTQIDSKQDNLDFSDLQGTTNQVTVDYGTNVLVGATPVTLSLPQNINTTADVTFNSLNLGGLTANRAIVTDASKNIISSSVTDVEIGYLSGVRSNIQDQIDSKEPDFDTSDITGTTNQVNVSFGTDVVIGSTPVELSLPQDIHTSADVNFANLNLSALTAERALIIDASNDIASSVTTNTELSYVNGVTSAIQSQLDSKQKELYKTVDSSGNGDYNTLKEAIDANETAIFIKNGTYLESTPITINYDNVSIIGENIEGTILRFGAGEDGIKLYANYSEIKNLTMDAQTNSSAAALVIGDGQTAGSPDTSNGNNNYIDHCRIMGSATTFALYVAGASYLAGTPTLNAFESNDLQYNNRVTNCILESTWDGDAFSFSLQKNGVISNNYCDGGRIAFYMCRESDCCNNSIVNSANQGIFVGCPAYSNNVNENKIYNSASSGFKIQNQLEHTPLLDGQRGFNNNFNNNTIFTPSNSGFEITGDADHEPKNNNFNGNTVYQADNHGFYLQDAHFNNFVGNTIYEPRSDSGTYARGSGFYLVQNVENNNINDNVIIDERDPYVLHTAIGNREGTDCKNNNVIGNKIVANNTERTVWVQSSGWNISNNYISGGYYAGIYLDQADNCNVVGNICENNTNQANNSYYEIWLNNTANNNIISNNTCISSAANVANADITVSSGTGNKIENNIGIGTTTEYATILSGLQDMGTSTGIVAQTGNTSFSKRTLTGTANEIDIADGDGVSGNPTFSLPNNVYLGASGTLGRDADNVIDFSTDNQISMTVSATPNQLVVNSAGIIGVNTNDIEAWDSAYSTIQFPRAAIATGATTNDLCLVNNAYNDGAMKFRADGYAQKISLDDDGSINFNISKVSGIADNSIIWNNTLSIDAAGLVTIENKNLNNNAYGFSVTTEQEGAINKTTGIGYFNANGSYVSSGDTSNAQYGVNVQNYINSDSHEGTINSLYGMLALSGIVNCGTGGTVTNNIGVASSVFATDDAGSIGTSYMFKGKLITVPSTPVTTITNNWGIYLEGCEDNYIEGDCTLTGIMTCKTFDSVVTNGDNYSYITASTPAGEAILYLTAGDGTVSSEVTYIAFRALESVQQTWMTGMFGDKNFRIKNHTDTTYPFSIDDTDDSILMQGSYIDPTTGSAMLEIRSTNTATKDVGGNLLFGGYHNGTSNFTNWAGIKGAKENATANNNASYLAFYTQDTASTPIEQMRIDSNGTIWADMNHSLAFTGYVPKMYVTKAVDTATGHVLQVTNTNNNFDANVTTKYPVLRLTRDGDLGNRVPSGVDFAVGCWENSSTNGRTELNINLTDGTSNYPEAKVFSLLSSVKAYMGAAANPQLKFQLADYGGIDYVGTEIALKYNTYYDGSEKWLRAAGNGCQIVLKDDGFTWYATNDSSTGADNAVTNYNTLMTLNNLGTLTQTSTYDGAVLHTLDNPSTGTSAVTGINMVNDSDNGLQLFTYGTNHSTDPDMCLIQANARPLKIKTIGSNFMTFYTNNIPVLTIDSSQNTNIASYNVTHQSNQNNATYHKIYNANVNASASALLQLANDAKTASLTLRSSVASSYANELTVDLLTGSAFNIVQGANTWLRVDSDDGTIAHTVSNTATSAAFTIDKTTVTSTYSIGLSVLSSGLQVGDYLINQFGQSDSTKNACNIRFQYAGSGSDSNYMSFGFNNADNLFSIYPTGNARLSGTLGMGIAATGGDRLYIQYDQNVETIARVRNDTSGTGASSMLMVQYSTTQYGILCQRNPSYTTYGLNVANSVCVIGNGNTNGMRIFTEDAYSLILGTNNTLAMTIDSSQVVKVGDATDNVELNKVKGLRQNGATTTWDDLRVPLTTSKQGSTSKPDFDYTNVGYLFPQNDATEILYFVVQMPHGWKVGSTIYPHIHWQQSANQNVTWKIDYKWFNNNTAIPASFTTLNLDQLVFTYTSGNLAQISEPTAGISGTGKNLSSFLLVKLYRDDNVYTGDALAFDFDIHYEQDSIGSDQEFTKT